MIASQAAQKSIIKQMTAAGSTTDATTGTITGTPMPFKQTGHNNMKQLIEASQQLVRNAREIVIAGIGPIRVSITLVSATDRVLPSLKRGGSTPAKQLLEQKKVKVITSRRVTGVEEATPSDGNNKSWTVSLDNGDKLSAGLYIPTTGVLPNSSFKPAQFLDKDGWVKVYKELRVKVYDQGGAVMMVVPVGKAGVTGQLFGITSWSFVVRMIKGKDFFVSKAASLVGAK
ncbi:Apoptosis-inducing factor [Penicillium atrosanguineum]|nr:Apoptosis-inducing factor [Penicillium atrosanguineum]